MRFIVVNLPAIVLVLAVGAAALPRNPGTGGLPEPMVIGPSHYFVLFFSAFNILLLDSQIGLDSEGPDGP